MAYRHLAAGDAFWRRSNQMGVLNTYLGKHLRIRVAEDLLTLDRGDALVVDAETVRQVFNDTGADALWLVVGAPPEAANTLEMSEETLAFMYPDGPKAVPPELES